jgi:Ca2+-binding RTX toxin-like protein
MVWHFPQSGVNIPTLAVGDDVFVAQQVFLNATISDVGVTGSGTDGHQIIVAGTIAREAYYTIILGSSTLGGSNSVTVEATGQVRVFNESNIILYGSEQRLINHGLITQQGPDDIGYAAVYFRCLAATSNTSSSFVNTGIIDADGYAIYHHDSTETLIATNSGTIRGGLNSFFSNGTQKDEITNTGTMIGDIELAGGDDLYDGRLGTVEGEVFGGDGNDRLYSGAGNDRLFGQGGNDTLRGGTGNDYLDGGAGNDNMAGGTGNDIYIVAAAADVTTENAGEGTDTVRSYINWTLGANIERLELLGSSNLNGTGNALANTLVGNSGNNSLSGGDGNDYIVGGAGNDTLNGGNQNDTLVGGAGADAMNGGAGNDSFLYQLLSDTGVGPGNRDTINGFVHGQDLINLAALDANAGVGGNQAFSFIGSAAFSGVAGQLRYSAFGNTCLVDGDVNGDSVADFQIAVAGTNFMTGTDFLV